MYSNSVQFSAFTFLGIKIGGGRKKVRNETEEQRLKREAFEADCYAATATKPVPPVTAATKQAGTSGLEHLDINEP